MCLDVFHHLALSYPASVWSHGGVAWNTRYTTLVVLVTNYLHKPFISPFCPPAEGIMEMVYMMMKMMMKMMGKYLLALALLIILFQLCTRVLC